MADHHAYHMCSRAVEQFELDVQNGGADCIWPKWDF